MAEENVAQGSRFQAIYAVEDSWGVLPSAYTVYNLRVTGFGVQLGKDSFQSGELRSDRQILDLRHGMFNVSGDIPVELSYGAFDDLIAAAMFNSWASNDTIETGTTQSSLRIQRAFTDVTEYHEFLGCVPSSWSVSIAPNSIITSTFSIMGQTMETTQTLTGAVDKATNAPMDSFSGYIREGGNTSSDEIAIVTGLDFTLENNLTPMNVVGNQLSVGLSEGRANLTGTLTAYFAGSTLLNKFLNETESVLEVQIADASANTYTFYMPRIKYSGGDLSVDGEGPVSLSLPFQALYDTSGGISTLQISR
jgi:hypothetical protein